MSRMAAKFTKEPALNGVQPILIAKNMTRRQNYRTRGLLWLQHHVPHATVISTSSCYPYHNWYRYYVLSAALLPNHRQQQRRWLAAKKVQVLHWINTYDTMRWVLLPVPYVSPYIAIARYQYGYALLVVARTNIKHLQEKSVEATKQKKRRKEEKT
jgi:hypothetical protein